MLQVEDAKMAHWTVTWRSSTWARWLGWTALCAVGLGTWDAALAWWDIPFQVLGLEGLLLINVLGITALAFAIGVRFAHWSWVFGVFVANVPRDDIVVRIVDRGPASGQAGLAVMFWFILDLLVMLVAAAAGVSWGKRRRAGGA